jgi:acyl carrier protein
MATRFRSPEEAKRPRGVGATHGIGVLSTRRALEALERLLEEEAVQAGVMPIDWDEWQRMYGSLSTAPYLSLVMKRPSTAEPGSTDGGHRERLLAVKDAERPAQMHAYLAKQIARILMLPLTAVEANRPISAMGFDSLMAIELRKQLETDLKVNIPMARLIQGPTPAELGAVIYQQLFAQGEAKTSIAAAPAEGFDEGVL